MIYNLERPETLDCVEGQDDTLMPLKAQCKNRRFAHSYLMTGHYGCGKTTVSRIMARAVNCENPTENGPCGKCPSCKLMQSGSSMDYIELDAASHNGVEDIRQIVEQCGYLPVNLKYRIFIIDEVHMLSTGAFNALLKTLEEPPEHVIFFLCTTEMHKVPKTIVSRCQIHEFRAIDIVTIATKLSNLCEKYDYTYDMDGLYLIAKASGGAMRDALSIFEQCTVEDGCIDAEKVRRITGTPDDTVVFSLLKSMVENDISSSVSLLQEQFDIGKNINFLLKNMLEVLSDILLALREKSTCHIYNTNEYKKNIEVLSDLCTMDLVFDFISKISEIRSKIQKDLSPEIYLQAEIIGLSVRREKEDELIALKEEIENLKGRIYLGVSVPENQPESTVSEKECHKVVDEVKEGVLQQVGKNNVVDAADIINDTESDENKKEVIDMKSAVELAGFEIGETVDLGFSDNEEVPDNDFEEKEANENEEFILDDGFGFPGEW